MRHSLFHPVRLGWNMLRRDGRAGELRLLLAALIVAVASVSSVGFFIDRIRGALERDAAQLLGADLVVVTDHAPQAKLKTEAARFGLSVSENVSFPSMTLAGDGDAARTQLASIKAVTTGYPLRGSLRVASQPGEEDEPTRDLPALGTVWVDPQLLSLLEIRIGDKVQLGDATFRVTKLIMVEPDRGMNFVNIAPRILMRSEDLLLTGLVTEGSRLSYRLLVAGEPEPVARYSAWLKTNLDRGQRLESLQSGRPEMRQTLDRAEQFLSLVALLSALIAAVAVALAARRFMLRHLDGCAVMRCLGATQRDIARGFAVEFLLLAVIGAALGCAVGYAGHWVLVQVLGNLVTSQLPAPSALPGLQGFAAGVLLLLGFALPPLANLHNVPPARVLRRDIGAVRTRSVAGYALGAIAFSALLLWFSRDLKLGALTGGGFAAGFALFSLVAWLGVRLLMPLRRMGGSGKSGVTWRFALAAVARRQGPTVAQIVAVAIGLMALLLLAVTRGDLVDGWRKATPPDAPNRFVINIQSYQSQPVAERLKKAGIPQAILYPMVRGRLVAVNGKPVKVEDYGDDRAKRLVDREFNLSYMDKLPSHNRLVQGKWFAPEAHEVSMEDGIMKSLQLKLGDELVWEVGGQQTKTRITSVREVEWDSMKVNFFAIVSPAALREMPQTWITAFHLPRGKEGFANELVRDYPNLTVIDTGAILRQVQAVLEQVITAVQFLFIFTLIAGIVVLYAALASSRDERMREAGLLRALGASRAQLSRAQLIELAAIGALAGLLAAIGATVVGWILAKYAFNFTWQGNPWVVLWGLGGGLASALAGGWIGLRGVLRTPPLATLREA
jgi:putative ABC transport system permease protein